MTESERGRSPRLGSNIRIAILSALVLVLAGCAATVAWRFSRSIDVDADPAFALRRPAPDGIPGGRSPAAGRTPASASTPADSFPSGVERLDDVLEPIRARHRVPALALAIVRGDSLRALGVVGVRRAGQREPAKWYDRFHIGSDTKSITATLVAMLIDDGRLRWDTTLEQLFPDLVPRMRPEYRRVTVEMLMHHRSGLPDDREDAVVFARLRALRGSTREQRLEGVALALGRRPASPPGTKCVYANANFGILGAAVERITGDSWESQGRRRVFEPLGMRTAGFGSPNTPGRLDQPCGHHIFRRWPPRLFWIDATRLPKASAASGNVSLSMSDWARYASLHLDAARGRCRLLSCASFDRLHAEQPPDSHFAAGWGVARGDSLGPELQHVGSDGWWYAVIVIAPNRDVAMLAAANIGGERGQDACMDAMMLARRRIR